LLPLAVHKKKATKSTLQPTISTTPKKHLKPLEKRNCGSGFKTAHLISSLICQDVVVKNNIIIPKELTMRSTLRYPGLTRYAGFWRKKVPLRSMKRDTSRSTTTWQVAKASGRIYLAPVCLRNS
jgi:hypothetical protein